MTLTRIPHSQEYDSNVTKYLTRASRSNTGTSLNWKEFSVKIREDDVTRLGEILRSIPMSRIRSKRRALRSVWTALSYNKIHGKENAIDHLLIEFRTRFSLTSSNLNAKSIVSVLTDEEWT